MISSPEADCCRVSAVVPSWPSGKISSSSDPSLRSATAAATASRVLWVMLELDSTCETEI
jgi:hypothetical protein